MAAANVRALQWPALGTPSPGSTQPPLVVYIVIMLVGGVATLAIVHPAPLFIAAAVCGILFTWAQRNAAHPVREHVCEQLLARPESLSQWGPDSERLQLAAVLCAALARAKKWPNDHFIPEDPIELAFFEVSGIDAYLEVFEVGAALTRKTGGKIDWHALSAVAKSRTPTLADLLEASLSHDATVSRSA